ncbi:MAG: DegT/DnrJ/EryC1/StrS family aminotransferase, partial [Bacteroidetes bacterium]|nr:DegT/DnrJ/EryC1/StrS family aminotransferase [Bacteroidota bacterium]
MPSPSQILTVLGKTLQNAFVSKAKWRFAAMSLTYKEKELASSQLHAYQNDQEGIIQEVELYFKSLQESPHAFTFFNARNALDAILKAYEFNEGDEIIVSPYCCVAVPNAVRF